MGPLPESSRTMLTLRPYFLIADVSPMGGFKTLGSRWSLPGRGPKKASRSPAAESVDEEALIHSKPGVFLVDSGHVK